MFDLSNIETNTYNPLKDGKYVCNITNATVKETKAKTGEFIAVELTIANGESKGRKIFTNFNIKNDNPKAVEIGLQQLKTMLEASDYANPNKLESVTALNGVTVGVKTRTKDDRSEVHFFFKPTKEDHQQADSQEIPF